MPLIAPLQLLLPLTRWSLASSALLSGPKCLRQPISLDTMSPLFFQLVLPSTYSTGLQKPLLRLRLGHPNVCMAAYQISLVSVSFFFRERLCRPKSHSHSQV